MLTAALPAGGVLVGRQAIDNERVLAQESIDSIDSKVDRFRAKVADSALQISNPDLATAVAERSNCFWELLPIVRRQNADDITRLVAVCVASYGDLVPNVEQMGAIIARCLLVRWESTHAAVEYLSAAGPNAEAARPVVDAIATDSVEVTARLYYELEATERLESVQVAQHAASFALCASVAELVNHCSLNEAGDLLVRSHFRRIAETAVMIAGASDLVVPDYRYESYLGALSRGEMPLQLS